ncbi:MAG: ABC transporter permease [Clostridia bacterium]|nr:ABC transporter permease [Clostridia bacterium]
MKKVSFSRKHLGIPYALFLIAFVVFPLLLIVFYAFTDANGHITFMNFINFFKSNANLTALFISLGLALCTTIICILLAYPVAYFLAKSSASKSSVLLLLFILPMWINFVLRTAAMKELLFAIGFIQNNKLSFLNTIIGMVYDYLPFAILPIYTVLSKMDKNLVEASKDLGASPIKAFFDVTVPLSKPGIISAITMIFLPTMTSYVISDTLGNGNITIIGKLIENQFSSVFNWNMGSAIALILLVFIFATMTFSGKFTDKEEINARGSGLW